MRRGFTLVELLIALAIVAVLGAIAMGLSSRVTLAARRAEASTNVRGIGTAAVSAFSAGSSQQFTGAPRSPRDDAALDKRAVAWVENDGFRFLGWQPDGDVRCNYEVDVSDERAPFVRAACDVDDDGEVAVLKASLAEGATWEDERVY